MSSRYLIAAMCFAEIVGMVSFATFPALLPTFLAEWRLTNTAGGWLNGIYYAGYMLAVPVLVSLTDRVDPRPVDTFSRALTAWRGWFYLAGRGNPAGYAAVPCDLRLLSQSAM